VTISSGVRIDKWLWAARFYKTRSLASRACEMGRVESNGQHVKPSREVRVGDRLEVKTESGRFEIEVLALSEMRGPAPVARALYRETDESIEMREKAAAERKAMPVYATAPQGKPSKRDRRAIHRLRGRA
jgi:ribosome-associated heat shock protein Hsp15